MNQREKNIRQLVYLVILISITTLVVFLGGEQKGIDFDKRKFTLDENTVITTLVLEGKDHTNRFEYVNGTWQVNDKYIIDQGMRDVLFAVLSNVEVKRPAALSNRDSLASALLNNGVKVSILNNGDTILTYLTGGNEELLQSYFMDEADKLPYLVHIPGYQYYLAGIFTPGENEWRSRFIWDIDWSSLKRMAIHFKDEKDSLVFEYENDFIGVMGINRLDTAEMMDYLESIAYLQTDKYLLKDEIPVYDQSIDGGDPVLTIDVEQIGNRSSSLQIYPKPEGKDYLPGLLNNGQRVLFQPAVLEAIHASASDFETQE